MTHINRSFAGPTPGRASARLLRLTLIALVFASLTTASAAALPEGRHYEMVSPEYKGGYGVTTLSAAAMQGPEEGDAVVFNSDGQFAGQPVGSLTGSYIARRTSTGWSTSPLLPPQSVSATPLLNEISPTMQGLYYGTSGPNTMAAENESQDNFFFHNLLMPDGEADFLMPEKTEPGFGVALKTLNGKPTGTFLGARASDPGFCTVVFRSALGKDGGIEEGEALLPEGRAAAEQVYELATGAPGCGSERALRLVDVNNHLKSDGEHELIAPSCQPLPGEGINPVTAGGSEVFFTPCPGEPGTIHQLYARLGGSRTIEVSRPFEASQPFGGCVGKGVAGEVPCAGAETRGRTAFEGANESGTRVFFTTTAPLVPGDGDTGSDLYMAQIGCPGSEPECNAAKREVTSLVQISHDPKGGEAAEVQGLAVLSMNGERVYFVAHGVLSAPNGEGNAPMKGAENLYVYDLKEGAGPETATTHFVADLCSGSQQSGAAFDRRCPDDLSEGESGKNDDEAWSRLKEAQTTGSGEFLVFTTYAQLVVGDTDTARDVYRYDAQTETLDRVSLGENGYDADGNNNAFNAEIPHRLSNAPENNYELNDRAISEDGSRIVFETAEPLSPDVTTTNVTNAYEWHKEPGWSEGRVGIVSNGRDEEPVGEELGGGGLPGQVMITPSGRDIFFLTTQGLVPQDTDGAEDVYDARLESGFPSEPVKKEECKGDACQGPLTPPAPLLVPGSVSQAAGENIAAPPPAVVSAPKKGTGSKCQKGRKRSHGRCARGKKARRASNKRRARR